MPEDQVTIADSETWHAIFFIDSIVENTAIVMASIHSVSPVKWDGVPPGEKNAYAHSFQIQCAGSSQPAVSTYPTKEEAESARLSLLIHLENFHNLRGTGKL